MIHRLYINDNHSIEIAPRLSNKIHIYKNDKCIKTRLCICSTIEYLEKENIPINIEITDLYNWYKETKGKI